MHIHHLSQHQKTAILIASRQMAIAHHHTSAESLRARERGADYETASAERRLRMDAAANIAAAQDEAAMDALSSEVTALAETMTAEEHVAAIQGLHNAWWHPRECGDTRGVEPVLLGAMQFAWHANRGVRLNGHDTIELHVLGERMYLAGEPPLATEPQLRMAHRLALALGHGWAHRLEIDVIVGVGDDDRGNIEQIALEAAEAAEDDVAAIAGVPGILAPAMTAEDLIVHCTPRITWSIDGAGVATIEIHRPGLSWCRWRDRKAAAAACEDPFVAAEFEVGPEPERGDRVVLRAVAQADAEPSVKLDLVDPHAIRSRHAETMIDLLFGAGLLSGLPPKELQPYVRAEEVESLGRRRMQVADRGPASLGEAAG